MSDYHESPHWNSYLATLDDDSEAGVIGFCKYLCDCIDVLYSVDAAQHGVEPTLSSVRELPAIVNKSESDSLA